jgi:hypothetical protein
MGWTASPTRRAETETEAEARDELLSRPASTWGWLTGSADDAGETPAQQQRYCPQELPIPMRRAPVMPWVRELTRLLDSRPGTGESLVRLRSVERALRTPGTSALNMPESLLRGAASELRWLIRRSTPTPGLARLLDRFENDVLLPAQRARMARTKG